MTRPYRDPAIMADAERLVVRDGLTIAEAAERLPVSERTVSDWSSEGGWVAKRRAHLARQSHLADLRGRLENRLAEMALAEDVDPQAVFAVARAVDSLKEAKSGDDGASAGTLIMAALNQYPCSEPIIRRDAKRRM